MLNFRGVFNDGLQGDFFSRKFCTPRLSSSPVKTLGLFVVKKSTVFFGNVYRKPEDEAKFDEHIFICFKWVNRLKPCVFLVEDLLRAHKVLVMQRPS